MNRLLLFALGLLVVGIAAISLVLLGTPADLEARADDILMDLSAGQYEAVWKASSDEFQSRYPLDRFTSVMQDFHGTMGTYKGILRSKPDGAGGAEPGVGDGLGFELQYKNGKAFCYIVLDNEAAPPQLRELLLRKES